MLFLHGNNKTLDLGQGDPPRRFFFFVLDQKSILMIALQWLKTATTRVSPAMPSLGTGFLNGRRLLHTPPRLWNSPFSSSTSLPSSSSSLITTQNPLFSSPNSWKQGSGGIWNFIPQRYFRVRSSIKKQCEHCYIRRKKNKKWYVYCKANPRHKQRQL